jgi:hypothetical protein
MKGLPAHTHRRETIKLWLHEGHAEFQENVAGRTNRLRLGYSPVKLVEYSRDNLDGIGLRKRRSKVRI